MFVLRSDSLVMVEIVPTKPSAWDVGLSEVLKTGLSAARLTSVRAEDGPLILPNYTSENGDWSAGESFVLLGVDNKTVPLMTLD